MFTVGLDVDSIESGIVVKLSQITGPFAGKPFSFLFFSFLLGPSIKPITVLCAPILVPLALWLESQEKSKNKNKEMTHFIPFVFK
jgi:hypothetical protein